MEAAGNGIYTFKILAGHHPGLSEAEVLEKYPRILEKTQLYLDECAKPSRILGPTSWRPSAQQMFDWKASEASFYQMFDTPHALLRAFEAIKATQRIRPGFEEIDEQQAEITSRLRDMYGPILSAAMHL